MALPFECAAFTNLLQMPLVQHKVSAIGTDDEVRMRPISHKPKIKYDPSFVDALKRLGLYHVCRMGHTTIRDTSLINALVERWRPETHTFHMPVGEMTITLQDVGCLLGLPISGTPVCAVTDLDWRSMVQNALGVAVPTNAWRSKGGGNQAWGFSIKLKWLRDTFPQLPQPHTPDQVEYYTHAYILDYFGSVLFPTTNGDDVPVMYVPFLLNLSSPQIYNWGGAVLAFLYRGLSIAARKKRKIFSGCIKLLQMWSWSRFAASKPQYPRAGPEFSEWGVSNLEECHPYGKVWTSRRMFQNPHNTTNACPRDALDQMRDGLGVVWTPYDEIFLRLPLVTQRDRGHWLARVPLIHFWIVSHHYQDKVMRQFGYRQSVPPPALLPWIQTLGYDNVDHTDHGLGYDWRTRWAAEIGEASQPHMHLVPVHGPHDDRYYGGEYMPWYHTHGMWTVYLWRYHGSDVSQARPTPVEPPARQAYLSQNDVFSRIGMRAFRSVVIATKQVITRGLKKVGKAILLDCRGNMGDVGQLPRFRKLMRDARLPEVVEDIPVDDDDASAETSQPYCNEERWIAAYEGTLGYDDLWIPPQPYETFVPGRASTGQFDFGQSSQPHQTFDPRRASTSHFQAGQSSQPTQPDDGWIDRLMDFTQYYSPPPELHVQDPDTPVISMDVGDEDVQADQPHTPVIEMDVAYSSSDDDIVDTIPLAQRRAERAHKSPKRYTPVDFPHGRQRRNTSMQE